MSLRSRIALATHGHRCPPDAVTIGAGVVLVDALTVELVDDTLTVEVVDPTINVEIINTDLELCNG